MKLLSRRSLLPVVGWIALAAAPALAQTPYPDLLYYKFDEGGGAQTGNLAAPGVGANPAAVNGFTLAPTGGQFGGALLGAGGTGSTHFVDTGWILALNGSFSISFWLDLTAIATVNPFMYALGDSQTSLRCFTNGASGAGNITLRSTAWSTGVIVPGGGSTAAPHHIAFVYDATLSELRGYLDGVRVSTVPVAPATYTGMSNFKVGVWGTATSLLAGAELDEFRFYSSALSDAEIGATWNISLTPGPTVPTVYCTSSTTTNNCVPSIGGTGTPSASAASGFVIDIAAVEGQKQGLIFYGLDNSGFTPSPWGTGFFCVKPPVQRTLLQSSGGTANACDGALTLDWNAFRAANPGSLGQPFNVGQRVFTQAWFRDPPSTKTTAFSDALEFTVGP
jgi:hypothetical protein